MFIYFPNRFWKRTRSITVYNTKERDLAPEELLADSLYGSDNNCERVKRLRVRGLSAVAYFARLKATAVNLFQAMAVRKALGLPVEALAAAKSGIRHTIYIFKRKFF